MAILQPIRCLCGEIILPGEQHKCNGHRMKRHKYYSSDLNKVAAEIGIWRREKGFSTPNRFIEEKVPEIQSKLMLAVAELGEACEASRKLDLANFAEEIADTIIRCLDLTDALEIDIAQAIHDKMLVNEGREHLHGKVN